MMQDKEAVTPLIQTKLHRPPLPRDLVARPRLTDLLDCQIQRPLTLVSAPAGYGKSTLISSWAEALDCPVAWISLDDHDSDLASFIGYFLGALQTIYPPLGAETRALIQGTELPPLVVIARTLINELNRIETDFVVVLDDYQCIRSTSVHDLIESLLSHPPQHLHLVLGTRIDPPISMNVLRARSQVTEIRLQDLRFTQVEAAILLEKLMGAPVEAATVAELEAHSEGWVTGLRLAALALRHRLGRDHIQDEISLNNRYVSEYLVAEILSQQSEQLAEQMLKIAILDRFCAGLCQAVCSTAAGKKEHEAASFIRWLETSNLFVIPLDDQGVWFRYHHLFQAFLQNELERRFSRDEIGILHCQASGWYAQNDLLEEAVKHALAAKDLDLAARLVNNQRIDLLFRQKWPRIKNLLKLFPRDFLEQRASLLNLEALMFGHSFNFAALLPALKRAEDLTAISDQEISDPHNRELESEQAFLWGFLNYWSANGARSLEKLNQAVELAPPGHTFIHTHALEYQIWATQMMGLYLEALELAGEANEKIAAYGPVYQVRIMFSLMVAHLCEGNLQDAEQVAQLTLKLTQENELYESLGWTLQALGYIYYQWNDLRNAHQYFAQIPKYRYRTGNQTQVLGSCGLARTLQALGETEQARQVSQASVAWAQEVGDVRMLVDARAWNDRLSILNGQFPKTLSWAASLAEHYTSMIFIEVPQISLVTILIAQKTSDSMTEAKIRLTSLREFCTQTHNIWHLIEVIALEALLFDALGENQKALNKLEEAIQHARPAEYLRVFVDLGLPMQSLLGELRRNGIEPDYIDRILATFPATQTGTSRDTQVENLYDLLTQRETEILVLLTQRLTNREIAEQLVLSTGTVKQHLYNIYQKMNVKNRRQAIAAAKDYDIFSEA
jgi:LuxR family maltose regulon positive regulatory protein